MGVRVVSDGYPNGTKVFDEAGNQIGNVRGVRWNIDSQSIGIMEIELHGDVIEASAERCLVAMTCPLCHDTAMHECDPNPILGGR